jgi:hypothetical protein
VKKVGQDFFPDAALAGDQHPRICPGDENGFVEETENGRAGAKYN